MYRLRNKVQLIGYPGAEPDVRITDNGKKRVRFNMVTTESYRNANGEKVTESQWHHLVAWGKVAELIEKHLVKGREIAIEGRLVTRSYNDKDGNKKHITEIHVNELLMLGVKSSQPKLSIM
jgi:single-strand DNA-binding protein